MSNVLVNAETLTRLSWIAAQLQTMHDNGWIRYEGDTVYFGLRDELASIVGSAQEPVTVSAPPVYNVMTAEQVALIAAGLSDKVEQAKGEVIEAISAATPAPTSAPTEAPAP